MGNISTAIEAIGRTLPELPSNKTGSTITQRLSRGAGGNPRNQGEKDFASRGA
jgi:hypothetical protein